MNKIQGKILTKESGIGIPNLLVVVYDIDSRTPNDIQESYKDEIQNPQPVNINYYWAKINGDRIGSVITGKDGEFELSYEDAEFMIEKKESRPDLIVFVLAPEENLANASTPVIPPLNLTHRPLIYPEPSSPPVTLYISRLLRANAGKIESYVIKISERQLFDAGIEVPIKTDTIDSKKIIDSFNSSFLAGNLIKKVLDDKAKENYKKIKSIKEKVKKAFENFYPSKLSKEQRQDPTYYIIGEDLKENQKDVIKRNLGKLNKSKHSKRILMSSSEPYTYGPSPSVDLGAANVSIPGIDLTPTSPVGAINIDEFGLLWQSKIGGTSVIKSPQPLATCKEKVLAERIINQITSPAPSIPATDNPGDGSINSDDISTRPVATQDFIVEQINQVSQSDVLNNSLNSNRANQEDIKNIINGFNLDKGPIDVTATHDFYDLKIAFENIWTEVFDEQLMQNGGNLYSEWVRLQDSFDPEAEDATIESEQDLTDLMNQIELFKNQAEDIIPVDPDTRRLLPTLTALQWSLLSPDARTFIYDKARRYAPLYDQFIDPANHVDKSPTGYLARNMQSLRDEANQKLIASGIDQRGLGANHFEKILTDLNKRLNEPYKFDIYAPDSFNFGILINYQQEWKPINFQVGDLVSTIPLTPKETRKYTKKTIVKKSRTEKEVENSLRVIKSDTSNTSRVESEIVNKAVRKSNFKFNTEGGVSFAVWNSRASAALEIDSASDSSQTKKDFREAVVKASEEYKQEHKLEIDTSSSVETEETISNEITNPNDELTVTYLFYELQRKYEISEQIHKLTPVVLIANEVPKPHEIDEDWLIANDYIIRRAILDDSFLPALDYLSQAIVGEEFSLEILYANMQQLQRTVAELKVEIHDAAVIREDKKTSMFLSDLARFNYDEANTLYKDLLTKLENQQSALETAIDKYTNALKDHLNKQAEISRLRVHVKQNILYYMQAIWDSEVPDQRYFRLANRISIPVFDGEIQMQTVTIGGKEVYQYTLSPPVIADPPQMMNLVDIADLDNLIGYKGNYMIFPMKKLNYLQMYMMMPYVEERMGLISLKDPDEYGDFTTDEYIEYLQCLFKSDPDKFNREETYHKNKILERLTHPDKEKETVIVPTESLYIEALPGKHSLMEDFKLLHRAVDVKKAQAEVIHAELENIRLSARMLNNELEDADIDKKIVVEGGSGISITPSE